jgi:chemotaxis protein CheC
MKTQKLTELQKDALREIANIGACHAATALSQLVQKKILIEVPKMSIIPFPDLTKIFDGPETPTVGMYTPIFGDLSGSILFLLPSEDALRIVDLLWGRPKGKTENLEEEDIELLRQTAGILVASYLSALSKFVGLTVLASSSAISSDMLGAVVDAVVIETDLHAEEAVLVETELVETANRVRGVMFFMPDGPSVDKILENLRLKDEF